MRGHQKPTVLKNLHGSDQPRNQLEPIPEGKLTEQPQATCPEHFNDDQRAAWDYAVTHSPPGMLKLIDAPTLESWVIAHCLHRRATMELNKRSGINVLLAKNGTQLVPQPLISLINKQALIMVKLASELGFTPVSRPRIGGGPAAEGLHKPVADARDQPTQSLEAFLAAAPRATAVH